MNSKRGMSPLIASLLVVAFSIIIAFFILAWSHLFITNMTDFINKNVNKVFVCSSTNLKIKNICYKENNYNITIENTGSNKITSIIFNFEKNYQTISVLENNNTKNYFSEGINQGEVKTKSIQQPSSLIGPGEAKIITAIPLIKIGDKEYICTSIKESFGSLDQNFNQC